MKIVCFENILELKLMRLQMECRLN